MSRKSKEPSFSSSEMNWMVGCHPCIASTLWVTPVLWLRPAPCTSCRWQTQGSPWLYLLPVHRKLLLLFIESFCSWKDQTKGEPESMQVRHCGYASSCRTHAQAPPPHQVGGDHRPGLARGHQELLLKEAIHIRTIPLQERLNRDEGTELSACWLTTLKEWEQ